MMIFNLPLPWVRTNPPPLFNHGEGIYFEGIEPMSDKANVPASMLELLTAYAVELQGETPVLSRYTDTMPRPDGLGGQAERERDQAMRRNLMYPDNLTELKMCVDCLEQFRDWRGVWEDVRGALLTGNQPGLAAELKERRERRTADLERMLAAARDLAPMMPTDTDTLRKIANADAPGQSAVWDIEKEMQAAISGKAKPTGGRAAEPPKVRALDYRAWDAAAVRFNTGVQGDVAFIENALAEKIVAAFSDFNDRLIQAGGKPFLKAAATPTHAPQNARAALVWLNDQVGLIPPVKIAAMSFREIVAEFEKCISINNQVLAKLGEVQVAAERAAAGVDELAAEMTAWREWVRELAKHPNAKPGEPKLCATVQGKICEIWQGFKNAPADCELPSGAFRKTKRTFAECLALHGHDEVWHGKRLIDFIPDENAFKRVVHNGAEKARQAKAKAKPPKSQKRKTQARRKK